MTNPFDETRLSAQSRAARVTHLLLERDEMSSSEIRRELGYSRDARTVYDLLDRISLGGVPIYQPRKGYWAILKGGQVE